MSKKHIKIKKIKKAIKLLKSKPTPKKLKREKAVKLKPIKKSTKEPVKKVQTHKVIKKKPNIKKVEKSLKKNTVKSPSYKVKPIKIKKSEKVIKPEKILKVNKNNSKLVASSSIKEKKLKQTTPNKIVSNEEKKTTKVDSHSPKKFELGGLNSFKQKRSRSRRGRKKKNKGDDDEPEILHDELVEQLIRSTKKLRAQPKVPKMLKTFTNPMASLTVAPQANASKRSSATPKKEPKGKFTLEYVIRTSAGILYEFLTTPSGLSEWFADDVNIHDGIFTFFWDGSAQKARLIGFKEEEYVRMQWLDKPEGSYFEFRIQKDDITGDVSLILTDFADEASDLETSKRLWDSQVDKLLHIIGSF